MRPVSRARVGVGAQGGAPGRIRGRVRPRPGHHLPAPLHRPHPPGRRLGARGGRRGRRAGVGAVGARSRRARNGRAVVDLVVRDETGRLAVVFFNQPWRAKQLEAGTEAIFFGKVGEYRGTRQMVNPVVDVVAGVTPGRRTLRILPVYPASAKAGLTSWEIGECVEEALERAGDFVDPLAAGVALVARPVGPDRGVRGHPPARVVRGDRRPPAAAWCSTSCSGCSSPSCCGGGPSRSTPAPCATTSRRGRSPARSRTPSWRASWPGCPTS